MSHKHLRCHFLETTLSSQTISLRKSTGGSAILFSSGADGSAQCWKHTCIHLWHWIRIHYSFPDDLSEHTFINLKNTKHFSKKNISSKHVKTSLPLNSTCLSFCGHRFSIFPLTSSCSSNATTHWQKAASDVKNGTMNVERRQEHVIPQIVRFFQNRRRSFIRIE